MKVVFERPESLTPAPFRYCPGCGHSLIHRLLAESVDALGIREKTIGIAPVGCAVFAYDYFNFDMLEVAHGRPPAAATAMKKVLPDRIIFAYQGDGDLAAIGTAETVHAANRGERVTCIFVNNAVYGMTGGQMAPTTVVGQETTTSPGGRIPLRDGYPLDLSEMLGIAAGSVYIERTSVSNPKNILKTKKAIKKAFEVQLADKGFSMVEILSPCPTNWKMTPTEAARWVDETMTQFFPLKVIKDVA